MTAVDEGIRELESRLARYPPARYPVQHATAQFHLGVALANAGEYARAREALAAAVTLFDATLLPLEHAKALNALGAVLRQEGRTAEAARTFEAAAAIFERARAPLEEGAAAFNLGLARRELGDAEAAVAAFEHARVLLHPGRVPAQAGAAARELGATLLTAGDAARAEPLLEEAAELAARPRDDAAYGEAANLLGLARLARRRADEAIAAFVDAAGAHPRSIRPHAYAMAKANLALAHEHAGDEPRARLAARQALGVHAPPDPVREQAESILARLPGGDDDLARVLEREPRERWVAIVREELVRWADADPARRRTDAAAWVTGQLERAELEADLAEAWLGALLELPPAAMAAVVRAALEALGERPGEDRQRFASATTSAMARFHTPQLVRLRETFRALARELGREDEWS